tara:strand:- start:130 stop:2007 length:1878 start_codon:yes stop_codon:yes gene_type:complete
LDGKLLKQNLYYKKDVIILMTSKFFSQIKYLYRESLQIIHEFGIRYYFNFGITQLKKQKLDLFSTHDDFFEKSKNIPTLNKKEQYNIWKEEKKKKLDSVMTNDFQILPKITIVLNSHESQTVFLKSIKSILNQSYSNWELFIIRNSYSNKEIKYAIHNLDDSLFEKITFFDKIDQSFVKQITSLMSGEFVCMMEKNIILQNNSFLSIVKTINQKTNFDLLYSDEEVLFEHEDKIKPFFKPDWSPYLFLQMNYVGNLFLVSKKFLLETDFSSNNSIENITSILQNFCNNAKNIFHLPEILFTSIYSKHLDFNPFFNRENISLNLEHRNIQANVQEIDNSKICKIDFELTNEPKVSIIIPTKNNHRLLSECIRSLEYNTNYKNFEIIIVDNNSNERTKSYLSSLPYNVILFEEEFNFSQMNNIALEQSTGDYILFLNDDTESIELNWLSEMVSICQQNDVGAVGAKLLYNDNTIQHAGMAHLKNGFFFHPLQKLSSENDVHFDTLNLIRECSSVTGACVLTTRKILNDIKNYDETFDVYYGDSDLCFKIRKLGYSIIFTPNAILRHDGSSTIRKQSKIFIPTENFYDFVTKWPVVKNGDPYYNSNFSYDYDLDISNASKSNLITKKE